VLCQSYNVDIGYIYRYLKLSVLWLHILFSPVTRVDRALCGQFDSTQCTIRYQHCNFGEAQAESSLTMIYVNRNMLEQLL